MSKTRSYLSLATRRSSLFHNPPPPPEPDVYYVGVDVGTGSVRACLIDTNGIIIGLCERPISRQELKANFITQSSGEIWDSICYCVRHCVHEAGIDPIEVFGISFDATCSLVVLDESTGEPAPVGPNFEDSNQNVILWMDHRAPEETAAINATNDKCLKYVGGQMSIEMEMPKIKWLKHHAPKGIRGLKFFDLADFLTHRSTGSEARSYCSAVCKQGFVPLGVDGSTTGWSESFLRQVNLEELVENDFHKLGGIPGKNGTYLSAGSPVGHLTEKAAEELGLSTDCIVGSSVIDAYAGWIGTVAAKVDVPSLEKRSSDTIEASCGRLAAVAGTSTCHIALTRGPHFVQGVWGPYRDVVAPGYWCAEGGQSITGALLSHVLVTHPAHTQMSHEAESSGVSKFDYLNSILERMVKEKHTRSVVSLAKDIFFYGDFHGNRSPVADPDMRASIIGQSMDSSVEDLALQYFAACEFIGQQTRHIVGEMEKAGHEIDCIFMSGGQCRNGLLMRLLADCTGKVIVIPRYIDSAVVFGTALLGAVASEDAVVEHCRNRAASKRNLRKSYSTTEDPPSPYTAPSATKSSVDIGRMQYVNSQTLLSQDYFSQPTRGHTGEGNDSDEETLSFGSKQNVQGDLSEKISKVGLKPLSSLSKSEGNENIGNKLWKIMERMTGSGKVIVPGSSDDPDRKLLNAKFKIFLDQCYRQKEYRKIVDDAEAENLKSS